MLHKWVQNDYGLDLLGDPQLNWHMQLDPHKIESLKKRAYRIPNYTVSTWARSQITPNAKCTCKSISDATWQVHEVMQKSREPLRYESKLSNTFHTFRTIVSFGFSTARPPGGSLGAPVTNWQKARCCSGVNSPMISSNYWWKRKTSVSY